MDGPQPHLVSKSSKLEFYTDSKMPSSFFHTPHPVKNDLFDIPIYAQILREQFFFGTKREDVKNALKDKTDSPLTGHTFLQGVCVYDVSAFRI